MAFTRLVRRLRASSHVLRYAVAASISIVAIALTAVVTEPITRAPSMLLFAAILVIAWILGLGPALFASLLAGAALMYLDEPAGIWRIDDRESVWMAVFFTTVLAMVWLTVWIRRLEDERARLLVREREARAQAEAANSAKDQFLAIVSHEMKTPLTAILAWTDVLRRKDCPPAERLKAADTIGRNARLQSKLIDDLLDVSRAVAGKLEVSLTHVDVSEIVRHVVRSQSLRARDEGVDLSSDVEPGVRILGDLQRLEQVFSNLVSNAIKFTSPGGLINVSVTQASGMARIVVRDSGEGMDPAHLEHVFDRFWQDSRRVRGRDGLGLGLAIVKHIVEEHGGYVRAQSPGRGHGATFIVDLPLAGSD